MLVSRLARLVAVVMMTAAAGLVAPILAASPAQAAVCTTSNGVTVVADFGTLGGGVRTACVPGGGGNTAAENFVAAGFPLTQVQRQPGFVCRISGVPQNQKCVNTPPTNNYWGLFTANGKGGGWSYATLGAYSLDVGNGEFVAFAFQSTGDRRYPAMAPVRPKPQPPKTTPKQSKPSKPSDPKPSTTKPGGQKSTSPGSNQSTAPNPTASPGATKPDATSGQTPGQKKAQKTRKKAEKSGKSTSKDEPKSKAKKKAQAQKRAKKTEKKAEKKARKKLRDVFPGIDLTGSQQGTDSGDGDQEEIGSKEAAPDKAPDSIPTWVFLLVVLGLAGAAGGATVLRRRSGS